MPRGIVSFCGSLAFKTGCHHFTIGGAREEAFQGGFDGTEQLQEVGRGRGLGAPRSSPLSCRTQPLRAAPAGGSSGNYSQLLPLHRPEECRLCYSLWTRPPYCLSGEDNPLPNICLPTPMPIPAAVFNSILFLTWASASGSCL